MAIATECARRREELRLDTADLHIIHETLQWGMQTLLEMQQCSRINTQFADAAIREEDDTQVKLVQDEASIGKRRPLESLENPNWKLLKISNGGAFTLTLQEVLRMVESNTLGEWMSEKVAANMKSSECVSVVTLIDHCLLLSMDQNQEYSEESSAQYSGGQYWLHAWTVKQILQNDPGIESENIRFPHLDWLLAYLTAARPAVFLQVLENECFSDDLSVYLRQAAILEFVSLSASELVASAMCFLLQGSSENDKVQFSLNAWIVQCAFCPNFLKTVSTAIKFETMETIWNRPPTSKHMDFLVSWTNGSDYKLDGLSEVKAWFATVVIKHFQCLSSVAAQLVLFMSEHIPSLLGWLNNKLSSYILKQNAGTQSLLMQNLKLNIHRLWDVLLSRPSDFSCSHSEYSLYQTCQITLLCSEDAVAAELLMHATVHGSTTGFALRAVVKLMNVFGVVGRDKLIFKVWAKRNIERLRVSECTQVLLGIQAIRQLCDPLFWDNHLGGTTWKSAWKNLCDALNQQWLMYLALLHRENREVSLNALDLLHFLSLEGSLSFELAAAHLKGALGLFFHRLRGMDANSCDDKHWSLLREIALLRKIIVQLASLSPTTFTLLVTILLDFSIDLKINDLSKNEHKPGIRTTLSRYGKIELLFSPLSDEYKDSANLLLLYNNPGSAVTGGLRTKTEPKRPQTSGNFAQLSTVLVHASNKCITRHQAKAESWTCHPAEILAKLLVDRLEAPHETSMTMDQYEEVLPKHITSVRHAFLIDSFHQNSLLLKLLEVVMEHGESKDLQACTEFVLALLADSISTWHSVLRNKQAATSSDSYAKERMKLLNIIQLVNLAQWLPQPLASCGEIISLINAEDIISLLFLIWRCVHDELYKSNQVKAEEGKEGSGCRDWEGQFLCILRNNVSRIGAHFARLYPYEVDRTV